MRIAIIGWPRTGKTTLGKKMAEEMDLPYRSTDETIALGLKWGDDSLHVTDWLNEPNWLIEGVCMARAFRKWRDINPGQPAPVDKVIYLKKPWVELDNKQIGMGKGIDKVLGEIKGWLPEIEYR